MFLHGLRKFSFFFIGLAGKYITTKLKTGCLSELVKSCKNLFITETLKELISAHLNAVNFILLRGLIVIVCTHLAQSKPILCFD